MIKLAPSILSADFARLGEQLSAAEHGGADWVHIDVMDGLFVPNITIGPLIVEACKRVCTLQLDVHLMIQQPERYIADFVRAGADGITIHAEATPHVHRAIGLIKEAGLKAGLALNPATPLEVIWPILDELDLVLLMSVNPGFGGQRFIPRTLERLQIVRDAIQDLDHPVHLQVDGGINVDTVADVVAAGADVLVAGSAIFNTNPIAQNIAALRQAAQPKQV